MFHAETITTPMKGHSSFANVHSSNARSVSASRSFQAKQSISTDKANCLCVRSRFQSSVHRAYWAIQMTTPANMDATTEPANHLTQLKLANSTPSSNSSCGIDPPTSLYFSSITTPLHLYFGLKGKFDIWDNLLAELPTDVFDLPALDVGCCGGMALLKIAQYKTDAASAGSRKTIYPIYGVDSFKKADRSGNSPEAKYNSAASLGLLDHIVLHTADFTQLPVEDETMGLVTASLSFHSVRRATREKAIMEMARVLRPGGLLVVVELSGAPKQFSYILKSLGWDKVEFRLAGWQSMGSSWPCEVLRATKPISTMNHDNVSTEETELNA
ncbi:altered inheritance of mitochondria protein 6 [Penicillium cataractarum]|uniref:Altered inheritance of mitochondria protein 6 n=1 Tax=Penicillium cataractarum TaxID=2100454 RepID=A0A9W9RX86_9EURO|nr:altered inheritance of mitochondria protein 6 [Penicillium cataractarum]KAJ5368073.1 altered inheritance of mitochondria protein 6 [Penicillium cataractarum]